MTLNRRQTLTKLTLPVGATMLSGRVFPRASQAMKRVVACSKTTPTYTMKS
jgi:hypothetical protein